MVRGVAGNRNIKPQSESQVSEKELNMFILKSNIKYFITNFVNISIQKLTEDSCKACVTDLALILNNKTETRHWEAWFLSKNNIRKIILKKEK